MSKWQLHYMLPCFAYIYRRMFHLSKRVTTGTSGNALLQQKVDLTTDIDNIDITIVLDFRYFTEMFSGERTEMELDDYLPYHNMLVMEHILDVGEQRYIADDLYSRYHKWQLYLRGREAVILALSEIFLIHFRTTHPIHNTVLMTDIYAERKNKAL